MKHTFAFVGAVLLVVGTARFASASEPIDIGSRLEPLVDNYLIDQLSGTAQLKMHRPKPREVILVTDKPWEGNTSAYYTVFRDGELLRMYYRGSHYDTKTKKATHREVTCYAESKDGIHWTKPNLGLFEFDGSKQNNIVWDGIGTHCFTVFKDGNPACPADARYKAISRGRPRGKRGLYAFKSRDGIHWSLMHDKPVITKGDFDSQNLAFWDSHAGLYREYHRIFTNRVRAIMTGTSKDFLHWSEPVLLDYGDAPNEHLYTNAVQPYGRAPHILLGFPTRYLPKEASRVEPVLMTSRDGINFHRWPSAVIPEDAPEDRSGNRSNYMTWGLVKLNRNELSVYATEAYYTGPDSRVRRFTYRVDGFVSLNATAKGGEMLSKPLKFTGNRLTINFATSRGGRIRIGIETAGGKSIEGFTLDDCRLIRGSFISHTVTWKNGGDLGGLAGKPIRLRIQLDEADLYSLSFGGE